MRVDRLTLACLAALWMPGIGSLPMQGVPNTAGAAFAQEVEGDDIAILAQLLQLDALFDVLRDEGMDYGASLQADMFPDGGGGKWQADLAAIYDVGTLRQRFDMALTEALASDPDSLAQMVDFFGSDLGQRIVLLEIEARRSMLDQAVDDAARVAADDRFADRDPLVPLLEQFIEAGDLIEMNVAGSMSGSLAFLGGLSDSGLYPQPIPDEDRMSQVWAQEQQMRDETTAWLYAYLGLAYSPLSAEEIERYVAFWESPAGQKLNAALFFAFDEVFRDVSYQLGRAAGVAMLSQDI